MGYTLLTEVVSYPQRPPETSLKELSEAFLELAVTIWENWLLVLIVVVLYSLWRRRRRARMRG
jgi:MYXO-CTERM domain-containing protein